MIDGKLFWTIARWSRVILDVRREEQRVAPADDELLALVRRAPIDFHGEFVRAHHFRRIGESFSDLAQEGQRPVGGGVITGETGVGELGGASRDGGVHERHRARVVPLLRLRRDRHGGHEHATCHRERAGRRREQRTHGRKIVARSGRGNGNARSGLEGHSARRRHAGVRVRAAAQRAPGAGRPGVRVPARVRAGRRRHVGALHIPRHRAARRVEARRTGSCRTGARRADGTATGRRRIRSRTCAPSSPHSSRSTRRSSARSGAARSAIFSYDAVRYIESLPHAPPAGVKAPDALFVFTGVVVIIDNLRAQARVVSAMRVPGAARRRAARARAHRARARRDRRRRRAAARSARRSRRSTSTRIAAPARGASTYDARKVPGRRRSHQGVHRRRRLLPGVARAPHRACRTTSTARRSTARSAR